MKKFALEYFVASKKELTNSVGTYVYRVLSSEDDVQRWQRRLTDPHHKAPYKKANHVTLREIIK